MFIFSSELYFPFLFLGNNLHTIHNYWIQMLLIVPENYITIVTWKCSNIPTLSSKSVPIFCPLQKTLANRSCNSMSDIWIFIPHNGMVCKLVNYSIENYTFLINNFIPNKVKIFKVILKKMLTAHRYISVDYWRWCPVFCEV